MYKKNNWKVFTISMMLFILTMNIAQAQCDWLTEDRDPSSYVLASGQDNLVLFHCEETIDNIIAPSEYIDVYWQYNSANNISCQDWGWDGNNYFLSIDYNDPCVGELENNILTVTFFGTKEDQSVDVCIFDILFYQIGTPVIAIDNYDTNEQIAICEQELITLNASQLGTSTNLTEFTWYLNGDLIEGQNSISLDIMSTNYDINSPNTFYFTTTNYCSNISEQTIESEWLTITIYEGYNSCEPCTWNLPDYDQNEFYGFCIDCDGDGYFPELPNNEENRSIDSGKRHPTCEATTYRITIFNRLGREIFKSEYNNHPWDGKINSSKKCKEGTYYYTMEYVLHPLLEEDNQNKTKFSTGTVYLDWGN
jgi:hypothetical protein